MTVLITGAAGFIGYHLASLLLDEGMQVIGIDSHNDYYDPGLKAAREAQLLARQGYTGLRGRIEERGLLTDILAAHRPEIVVHLAAQAGVRHSIENPRAYIDANVLGLSELLEAARAYPPKHLLVASSSSVYGASPRTPSRETDRADWPLSLYAATKKAGEAMTHSYAHLFDLPITAMRFFTVYGPWGRPDMAPHLFTSALMTGRPIPVFNNGQMQRDFTYVADVVEAIRALMDRAPRRPPGGEVAEGDSVSPVAPWRVVNVGCGTPVPLMTFINALEDATGRRALIQTMPMQAGDVTATLADTTLLRSLTGETPRTTLAAGTRAYVEWFSRYYAASGYARPNALSSPVELGAG